MQGRVCVSSVSVCFCVWVCICVYWTCAYVHSITTCIPQMPYTLKKGVLLSCNLLGLKASEPKILTCLHFCFPIAGIASAHYCGWLLKSRFWDRIRVFILSMQTVCKLRYLLCQRMFSKSPKNGSCPWKQNTLKMGAFMSLLSYEEIVYLHDFLSSNSWCCQQTLAFISVPFVETYDVW